MDIDWTPMPGNLLANDHAQELINRFRSIYRLHTEGRPTNIPTWVTFPKGTRVEESILSEPPLANYESLYFHIENRMEVYVASPNAIARYFSERNPWETDWDFYVFDEHLKWAIAFTHELSGGTATILVGEMPPETGV